MKFFSRAQGDIMTCLVLSCQQSKTQRYQCNVQRGEYAHRSEVALELVRAASGGAECRVQAGEVLVVTHLDETGHGLCREADEVQVSGPATHGQVPQLQVDVTDACFS